MSDSTLSLQEAIRSCSAAHLIRLVEQSSFCQQELNEALHEAVWTGSLHTVRILVSVGANIHSFNSVGAPLLLGAVRSGNVQLIEYLLQEGYRVDSGVGDSQTTGVMVPLHMAILKGDILCVEILLSAGASPEYRDIDGDTCLIAAVVSGQLNMVERLLRHHCVVNARGLEGNTALHRAVQQGYEDIVHILLATRTCDVNIGDQQGNTAFFLACFSGNLLLAKLMADSSTVDAFCRNRDGETAFHMAAKCGDVDMIALLVQLGLDYSVPDIDGNNPLIISTLLHNEDFALKLVEIATESNGSTNIAGRGKSGRSALHWASWKGLKKLVSALLQMEPSLGNVVDDNGDTPFILAAKGEQFDVLGEFAGRECNPNIAGEFGRTVLNWLSIHNGTDAMETILTMPGVDVNIQDATLSTPLLNAVRHKNYACARLLLSHGAHVNLIDAEGRSCLYWACLFGCTEITQYLLNHGADTNNPDKAGDYPLTTAAKGRYQDAINLLLAHGAHPDSRDSAKMTALHHCARQGLFNSVKVLLACGCDFNMQNESNATPVLLAAEHGFENIVMLLLEAGCDVSVVDNHSRLPIFFAAQQNMLTALEEMLSCFSQTENDCYSCALIQASKHGHVQIVSHLISVGATVDFQDLLGRTALLWAAQSGHMTIVDMLLNNGADPKYQDFSGDTSLILAAWHGHSQVVCRLLPVSDLDHQETEEGMSALHLAVSANHLQTAHHLLHAGASIDIQDNRNNTVLITAAIHSPCEDMFRLLLESEQCFDINFQGEEGRTAIHLAVRDPICLNQLLLHQPDVNCVDNNGASALLLAIAHGQRQSAQLLVEAGCYLNSVHEDGRCPIHHAVLYNDVMMVQLLLSRGVDPNTTTVDGRTPLLLASMEGHFWITEVLLSMIQPKCTVNQIFFDAITPLSAATASRHYSVMQALIQHGSDPDLIGNQKPTPLLSCIYGSDLQGAVMLLQAGAKINRGPNKKQHPVEVAAMTNNTVMLQLLATLDCDINYLQNLLAGGAMHYFVQDAETLEVLERMAKNPKSLQALCRCAIRTPLCLPIVSHIRELPVPNMLKNYLAFTELNVFLE